MNRLLLSLLVITSVACVRAFADDLPKSGPVRLEGQITDKDPRIKFQLDAKSSQEMRARLYDLQFVAGKRYTITLDAVETGKGTNPFNAFDPFLVVQDSEGKTLAFDDDSGGKLNARIRFECKRDGAYHLVATGLGNPEGEFTLKIGSGK